MALSKSRQHRRSAARLLRKDLWLTAEGPVDCLTKAANLGCLCCFSEWWSRFLLSLTGNCERSSVIELKLWPNLLRSLRVLTIVQLCRLARIILRNTNLFANRANWSRRSVT